MRIEHLTDDELDLLVLGEESGENAAEHAATCLVCRRRLRELQRAMSPRCELDPPVATRERVREAALAAWRAPRPAHRPVWWWAAAAALVAALALPLLQSGRPGGAEVDAAEVLAQVDALLAGDPVSAAFSAELVTALAVEHESNDAGSTS